MVEHKCLLDQICLGLPVIRIASGLALLPREAVEAFSRGNFCSHKFQLHWTKDNEQQQSQETSAASTTMKLTLGVLSSTFLLLMSLQDNLPLSEARRLGNLGGRNTAAASSEYPTCEYDSSNPDDDSCSLQALQATNDPRFGLLPGGNARCGRTISKNGSENPYFFQVDPGKNGKENNLLIAFQGGGSFLGFDSDDVGARAEPAYFEDGIFDLDREDNPLRDWTRVLVTYCTGDFHAGAALDVDEENGDEYAFNGRANTLIVLDWVRKNIPNPERVFLYGSSAGSLGVQLWSDRIISYYKSLPNPPVISLSADSATGLTRPEDGFDDRISNLWKACSPQLGLTSEEVELCQLGLFNIRDFQVKSQTKHRDVPFSFVNFKFDRTLYNNYCGGTPCVTESEFYDLQKEYLQGLVSETDNNVLTYWIGLEGHVVVKSNGLYLANEGVPLRDWIEDLVTHEDGDPPVLQSDCIEEDIGSDYFFDPSCDPVLLGGSFLSAGASDPPIAPELPCPCTCESDRGPGVFLTREGTSQFQCIDVVRAEGALESLSDVLCLLECP